MKIPALENQNKLYETVIQLKDKENKGLNLQLREIEKRWQNQAREPYKYT